MNEQTIIGAGGELSDFQYILTLLDELSNEDFCADDGAKLSPKEIYAYLSRVLYNRRSKCAASLINTHDIPVQCLDNLVPTVCRLRFSRC